MVLQTLLKFRLDLDYWNHSVVEKRKMVRGDTNQGLEYKNSSALFYHTGWGFLTHHID